MKRDTGKHILFRASFSLLEISIAALVFIVALITILFVYVNSSQFTDLSFDITRAMFAAQTVAEEYRNYPFENIAGQCPSFCDSCSGSCSQCMTLPPRTSVFSPEGFGSDAKGVVYICRQDDRDDLLRLTIVISFRQGQRIVGEDSNLNGVLDSGEDKNGNGLFDSPVTLTRLVTKY